MFAAYLLLGILAAGVLNIIISKEIIFIKYHNC
jgi:uncharacterized membrane protein YraQ (UPF0718 family)